jgi:hypothetical protein
MSDESADSLPSSGINAGAAVEERLFTASTRGQSFSAGGPSDKAIRAEETTLQIAGIETTEVAASAFRDFNAQWSVVAFSNQSGAKTDNDYACWRDSYATRCQYDVTWSPAISDDPTIAVDWNSVNEFFVLTLNSNNTSVALRSTTNPCPQGCGSPSWAYCPWGSTWPGGIDYPQLVDAPNSENMWFVANQNSGKLVIGRLIADGGTCANTNLTWWDSTCSALSGDNTRFARGVMVNSEIWMTYYNFTEGNIQFIKFDTSSGAWNCDSKRNIAPIQDAPANCASCSNRPVIQGVSDGCLRATRGAYIDVSDPLAATPVAVVGLSAQRVGNDCGSPYEGRVYRSTDGGNTWAFQLVTGCQTALQLFPAFARTPESGVSTQTVEVMGMFSSAGGLFPGRWTSNNLGANWNPGEAIGATQFNFPNIPGAEVCYWGDYQAVAPDLATNTMLHLWNNGDVAADWVIRNRALNP